MTTTSQLLSQPEPKCQMSTHLDVFIMKWVTRTLLIPLLAAELPRSIMIVYPLQVGQKDRSCFLWSFKINVHVDEMSHL